MSVGFIGRETLAEEATLEEAALGVAEAFNVGLTEEVIAELPLASTGWELTVEDGFGCNCFTNLAGTTNR